MHPFEPNYQQNSKELIKLYEQSLSHGKNLYFDSDSFETIIMQYIEDSEFEKAMEVCDRAMEQHPYVVFFMLKRADLLIMLENYEEAESLLYKASLLEPYSDEIFFLLGYLYDDKGELEKAVDFYKKSLEIAPERDDVIMSLVYAYESMDRYEDAASLLRGMLEKDSEDIQAIYELAHCFDMLGNPEESISFYEKIIDNDPYNHKAWSYLGRLYARLGLWEKAYEAYEYAIIINPNYTQVLHSMAQICRQQEKIEKAIELWIEKMERSEEDPITLSLIGNAYLDIDEFDKAGRAFQRSADLDPEWSESWYGLGYCMDAKGDISESIKYFEKAIDCDPEVDIYWFAIADEYHKANRLDESIFSYERAIELQPEDALYYLELASVYTDLKEIRKALDVIMNGIKVLPENDDFKLVAGALHLCLNDTDAAISEWEQMEDSVPNMDAIYTAVPEMAHDDFLISYFYEKTN